MIRGFSQISARKIASNISVFGCCDKKSETREKLGVKFQIFFYFRTRKNSQEMKSLKLKLLREKKSLLWRVCSYLSQDKQNRFTLRSARGVGEIWPV